MIVGTRPKVSGGAARMPSVRIRWLVSMLLFVVLPVAILLAVLSDEVLRSGAGYDFSVDLEASKALLHHGTPYAPIDDTLLQAGRQYVYPPLTAIALIPFAMLPTTLAGLLAMVGLAGLVLAIPLALGVRDLRCLGLLFLWPPVVQGLQTSNVAIPLVFAGALAWRFRDRAIPAGLAVGTAFAVKFALGPIVVWFAATRRVRAAVWSLCAAAFLLLGSWAVIGLDGLTSYPHLLRRLDALMDGRAYSLYAVLLDVGASSAVARLVWLGAGTALLAWAVVVGRRGDERRSYVLAVAATLALSPIVWLESFVALVIVVALARPRLALVWFVPLAMWVTAGDAHDPSPVARAATLGLAALTVALALLPERGAVVSRAANVLGEAA
jgi:alpha-1,2-mannosyltransferase